MTRSLRRTCVALCHRRVAVSGDRSAPCRACGRATLDDDVAHLRATDHLRRLSDGWRPVPTWTDAQLADEVRSDEIDVLVDLSGHTAGNRLLRYEYRKPYRFPS